MNIIIPNWISYTTLTGVVICIGWIIQTYQKNRFEKVDKENKTIQTSSELMEQMKMVLNEYKLTAELAKKERLEFKKENDRLVIIIATMGRKIKQYEEIMYDQKVQLKNKNK